MSFLARHEFQLGNEQSHGNLMNSSPCDCSLPKKAMLVRKIGDRGTFLSRHASNLDSITASTKLKLMHNLKGFRIEIY